MKDYFEELKSSFFSDDSEDQKFSCYRLIVYKEILENETVREAYNQDDPDKYNAQQYLIEHGLLIKLEDGLIIANPLHKSMIDSHFIKQKLEENSFYQGLEKPDELSPVTPNINPDEPLSVPSDSNSNKPSTSDVNAPQSHNILLAIFRNKWIKYPCLFITTLILILSIWNGLPQLQRQIIKFQINQIDKEARDAYALLSGNKNDSSNSNKNNQIDNLITALESGSKIKKVWLCRDYNKCFLKHSNLSPLLALQYILDNIYEKNFRNTHYKSILTLSFSQDDKYLASAGDDGSIRIWDFKSKNPNIKTIEPENVGQGIIKSLRFIPNINPPVMVTGGTENQTLKFWDISGKNINKYPIKGYSQGRIEAINLSSDGKILANILVLEATQTEGIVQIAEINCIKDKCELEPIPNPFGNEVKNITLIKKDNNYLIATSHSQGEVKLWTLSKDKKINGLETKNKIQKNKGIQSLSFTPNGQFIITVQKDDGVVDLWDLDGKIIDSIGTDSDNIKIGFTQKEIKNTQRDYLIIINKSESVTFYRIPSNAQEKFSKINYEIKGNSLSSISSSSNGNYIATGESEIVRLWNLENLYKENRQLIDKNIPIKDIKIGKNGDTPYIVYLDDQQLNITTKDPTPVSFPCSANNSCEVNSFTVTPDRSGLFTVETDNHKKYIRFRHFNNLKKSNFEVTSDTINNEDIKLIAGKQNYFLTIYSSGQFDFYDGGNLLHSQNNNNNIKTAVFTPDGLYFVTVTENGKAKLWTVNDVNADSFKDSLFGETKIKELAFSSDGSYILTLGQDDHVKLWSFSIQENFQDPQEIPLKELANETVKKLEFSPNPKQKMMATADKNQVKLWDYQGHQIAQFDGDWTETEGFSFTHNGKELYAAGDNGKIQHWDISKIDLENPLTYLNTLLYNGCKWLEDYKNNSSNSAKEKENLKQLKCRW